jgi:ABC-2 type transport system permease protein
MKTVSAAWTLAVKDLRGFVRDKTALVLTLLVPIALVTVFGWIMAYAFGGPGAMPQIRLHVADLAQSELSGEFVKQLDESEMLRVRQVVVQDAESDEEERERARQMVRDGDATHVLIIPPDFDKAILSGDTPQFQMFRDPGREMEDRIIQIGMLQTMVGALGPNLFTDTMDRVLSEQGMDAESLTTIRGWMDNIGDTIGDFVVASQQQGSGDGASDAKQGSSESEAPVDAASTNPSADSEKPSVTGGAFDSGLDANSLFAVMSDILPMEAEDIEPPRRPKQVTYQQAQSVAGMTVMMLLFALTSCASVLLTEREEGTLRRLFAQPMSRNAVLLGKFFFVMCVGLLQIVILFVYGEWMFRVGLFNDPITLIVLSLTWVATGGAFGMFLAAVSRSTKQAESLASLLILMMAALGGCWFPLQMMNLPVVLETVCKSTMTYWAMSGFQGMLWNQLPWYTSKTLTAIGFQWAWAVSFTVLAVFFFRRNFCRG